ncbi:MAG: hypothetical protein ABW071_11165, partial [Casimicrobiaceae bacterium]
DALFALARDRLAPNGVMFVSYNAVPGARIRQTVFGGCCTTPLTASPTRASSLMPRDGWRASLPTVCARPGARRRCVSAKAFVDDTLGEFARLALLVG